MGLFSGLKKAVGGIFKGVGKIIKGVGKLAKKFAPLIIAGVAIWATGGMAAAAMGASGTGFAGWGAALKAGATKLGTTSLLSTVATSASKFALPGAAVGAASSLITGQDPIKGALMGAAIGTAGGVLTGAGAATAPGAITTSQALPAGVTPAGAATGAANVGGSAAGMLPGGAGAINVGGALPAGVQAPGAAKGPGFRGMVGGMGGPPPAPQGNILQRGLDWAEKNPLLASVGLQTAGGFISGLTDDTAEQYRAAHEDSFRRKAATYSGRGTAIGPGYKGGGYVEPYRPEGRH